MGLTAWIKRLGVVIGAFFVWIFTAALIGEALKSGGTPEDPAFITGMVAGLVVAGGFIWYIRQRDSTPDSESAGPGPSEPVDSGIEGSEEGASPEAGDDNNRLQDWWSGLSSLKKVGIALGILLLIGAAAPGGDTPEMGSGGEGGLQATDKGADSLVIYREDIDEDWGDAGTRTESLNATGFEDGYESEIFYSQFGNSQRVISTAFVFNTMTNASSYYSEEKAEVEQGNSTDPLDAGEQAIKWGDNYGSNGHNLEALILKGNAVWHIRSDANTNDLLSIEEAAQIATEKY